MLVSWFVRFEAVRFEAVGFKMVRFETVQFKYRHTNRGTPGRWGANDFSLATTGEKIGQIAQRLAT